MNEVIQFTANHFRSELSATESRELFRASVRYVEIETFTYCNRKCWFCPNSEMPSRQDKAGNQYMGEPLYLRILDELASIGFSGQVQFGRYNEPLADRIIIKRITQARECLPRAWLYTHTNGDYLTSDYLDALRAAGLNEVALQTYLGNNERWDDQAVLDRQAIQRDRLGGLRIRKTITYAPGLRHYHETDYRGMTVRIDARNFEAIGTDRGGLVPIRQYVRTAPCMIPFTSLYIDCDGSVMPCCNLRSDRPEHAEFVACRLQDGHSIFDAFAALHNWRKSLMRFGPKSGPCATCRYDEDQVSPESAGELERIYQLAVGVT